MTPDDFAKLKKQVDGLQVKIDAVFKPDRYFFSRDIDFGPKARFRSVLYGGIVSSSGTAITLPVGWSSVRNSTGNYTITHKLGTTNYVVVATTNSTGIATSALMAEVMSRTKTTFVLNVDDYGDIQVDPAELHFIVMLL